MASAPPEPSSPWVAGQQATPLRAWGTARLQPIRDRLDAASREWVAAWGLPAADGPFTASAAKSDDALQAGWVPLAASTGDVQGWLSVPDDDQLRHVLCGGGAMGRVAPALSRRCGADAMVRLSASLGLSAASGTGGPGLRDVLPWSGTVRLQQAGEGWRLVLLLKSTLIERTARHGVSPRPARPRVTTVGHALRHRSVALQVRLEGCSLALGTLAGLRVGDVVRLEHGVGQAATVTDRQGRSVFTGHLARHGVMKAVALAARDGGGDKEQS